MATSRVRFTGATGHAVTGSLDLPDQGAPRAIGLFAHCFTCSKNVRLITEVARQLNAEGIGLLRFDFTGLGQSDGKFADTTFATNLGDLIAAAQFLKQHHLAPRFLVGHSLGGAAVLSVASEIETIQCVVTIGAPAETQLVQKLVAGVEFGQDGIGELVVAGRTFQLGRQFVDDLSKHDVLADVASLRRPLLVFHGPRDQVVGIDHAERIFHAARHPKSFVSLGDADHLVGEMIDASFVGHVLSAWVGRYLG